MQGRRISVQTKMAISSNVVLFLTALVGILCFLGLAQEPNYSDNDARVLILGAGAAGLQAARSLRDAGIRDFIIIEAADRIGGRVADTQFAGMTVELGSTWALPEVSRVVNIVQDLGLSHRASNYDSLVIRNDTGDDVTDVGLAHYDRLDPASEKVEELRDELRENSAIPDMSQRSALRVGKWIPETATEKIAEWFEYDITYGDTPETTSTKQTYFIGEEYWMTDAGGLKQIFDEVAGFLQEPEYSDHVRLNQKVKSIDYTNDISVVVTCEDGTRYIGEYVLLTFSIGVLQHDLVEFIPPLPEWKDVEIKKFQITAYAKAYVSFPEKFWGDAEWILHASDRRGYYPGFFNFQAAGFFPDGTPTLVALITGDEGRRVEAQPAARTKAEIQEVLRGMYGDSIPEATDILVTDWTKNPLFLGSFSNFPVEVTTECFYKLQSRVDRVFFGGEATSLDNFGNIDGALESGDREAKKIFGCMDNFEECPVFEGDGLECEDSDESSGGNLRFNAILCGILICLSWIGSSE